MTNSFNPSLGVDTSKTNYLQTEVDMTEATNKQIDENVKLVDKHFDQLIKMHNDSIKANQKGWKELAQFTTAGVKFAKCLSLILSAFRLNISGTVSGILYKLVFLFSVCVTL